MVFSIENLLRWKPKIHRGYPRCVYRRLGTVENSGFDMDMT